jgi:branched-chain amino acid transport system permease protein
MALDLIGLSISYLSVFGIFSILALSLNLEYGFAGQPNFGQVLFYGLGAFSAGIVSSTLLQFFSGAAMGDICTINLLVNREAVASANGGVTTMIWILALVIAVAIGAGAGFLASFPALRVKEEWYLGMILLVAGEIFRITVRNTPTFFCGYNGLAGLLQPLTFLNKDFPPNFSQGLYAGLILLFALGCFLVAQRLSNSPFGRVLKAVRDDRVAAEAAGKDINRIRRQVLIVGSAMAGLAGGLYAFYIGVAIADDYISAVTFSIFVMIVLGGIANNRGVFIGVAVLTALDRGTLILGGSLQGIFPLFSPDLLSYLRYLLEAGLLLFLLMFRPKGIFPEGRIKTKAYTLFDFGKGAEKTNEQPAKSE